ncbi:MAG: lysostaphin resistance A-like protein, partial [Candidatus Saccharimonadales bacterium]
MTKQKLSVWQPKSSRPWDKVPKWLLPILLILLVGFIFFVSQYASSLILSLYAVIRGWNSVQANNWLNNSVTAQFLFVLLFEGFSVVLLWLIFRRYGKSLSSIGLKKIRLRDGGYGLLAYPAYLVIYLIAIGIATHFIHGLNVNQSQNIGFASVHGSTQMILTFISLVILPPIAEELLFRGLLFEGLKKSIPVVYAGLLTSLIFAAAHLPEGGGGNLFWIGALDVFILSLVLVYLKQKTKSLWPGIFLHAIKNAVAFIYL